MHIIDIIFGYLFAGFIDFINSDLGIISEKFDLDLTSFSKREDIEISSHYIESVNQLSLNFTIPS